MKWRNSLIMVYFACVLTVCSMPSAGRAAAELIPLYTPPAGGTAYVLGAGIVTVTNKYTQDTQVVHEAATGTMEMVRRMMQREAMKKPALAVFGTPDGWKAYKGEAEYTGKPFTTLRAIVFINASDQYLITLASSGIKSFYDVKGKRIGIGGPGSTVANSAMLFLEQFGIRKQDFKPYFYNYKEVVEGLQDGSLDGGFVGGGYPIASYSELAARQNARIVPVDEKILDKVVAEHPYYYKTVVKAKSYRGLEQDTPIYGFATALWAHSGMSTEYVYALLKNLFDHKADYYAIHTSAKDMTLENALKGIPVPLHPGAEKYYREVGILKK
ncbi:MAG TPA: TAXI family TRAP transporter solute-binding subunit [Syntrophorhabdales bacterium]|nr:TAXI family TRAP transporter solute-binding subunit [Syntrophorhabdales bacterium]